MRKPTTAVLILFSAVFISFVACRKHKHIDPASKVYVGKVLRDVCGNITVQFTDGTPLGQIGWIDEFDTTSSYNNVFAVANPCTWGKKRTNEVIKFRILRSGTPQSCVTCLAYAPVPDTAYHILVIE